MFHVLFFAKKSGVKYQPCSSRISGHHDDIVDLTWAQNSQFFASCSKAEAVATGGLWGPNFVSSDAVDQNMLTSSDIHWYPHTVISIGFLSASRQILFVSFCIYLIFIII